MKEGSVVDEALLLLLLSSSPSVVVLKINSFSIESSVFSSTSTFTVPVINQPAILRR